MLDLILALLNLKFSDFSDFFAFQDYCSLEAVQTVLKWSAPNKFSSWRNGAKVNHRPDLQRLHFLLWIRCLYEVQYLFRCYFYCDGDLEFNV